MRHILLEGHDPAANLALEEALLRALEPGQSWFLLWRNSPCVIIGRHQDAAREVSARNLARENIPLLRRVTGGGAVYHDLGNLNFSFIARDRRETSFRPYIEVIRQALGNLGINAEATGRNDLEIEGGKISGSAQFMDGDKLLHHGTLLINVNHEKMNSLLTPSPQKRARHSVPSRKARVINIQEIYPDIGECRIKSALISAIAPEAGSIPAHVISAAGNLRRLKYENPAWNMGDNMPRSSSFSRFFPWGELTAAYSLADGRVWDFRFNGDFFAVASLEHVERSLTGQLIDHLPELAKTIAWENIFRGCDRRDLIDFFDSFAFHARKPERPIPHDEAT